ncbi:FtsH protease activity modulator HflK [Limibaculum sp. M0105]|uniref:Protein HflK n=1 Tax=Thermohalobaculum xanthum TaxID=2753746 RepID=A0A8J7SGE6_9RHOB|nr:FtsH protease activity modulator HflK [Thermohalobaculum xanthum]MBK0400831.1 FtsH protease activity modulator HflK [Thermohalobaculum xanthum]
MPFNSNSGGGGGPWGGGGGKNGGGRNPWGSGGGGGGGGGGGQGPDLDDLLRKGRDQLKVVLGGRGGRPGRGGGFGGGGRGPNSGLNKAIPFIIPVVLVAGWAFQSFYRVDTGEQSVELFLGEFSQIGTEGLNFAPWPLVTYEVLPVARENTIDIGVAGSRRDDQGLMLTGDENVVDIDFSVVWNISRPDFFLFNLADPAQTIRAVSESAMREIIGRSDLKPILSRERGAISAELQELIQQTLDNYQSGVNIVRVNFDRADPPGEVIEAFRDVQAAAQDRQTEERRAEAYANQTLAGARGEAAQVSQQAEGYAARVVNEAKGEAARFVSIYEEYRNAPDVTRKRLYIETLERVLGSVDKIIIDEGVGGSQGSAGVVPYLPLNELRKGGSN